MRILHFSYFVLGIEITWNNRIFLNQSVTFFLSFNPILFEINFRFIDFFDIFFKYINIHGGIYQYG